jgi:chromosome segregation ATPase
MRFVAANGEDPFQHVKGLIADMLAKLEDEAGADAKHKAYCDKEMSDSNDKKEEKSTLVAKLTTKIGQMSAESERLKGSVATLQKELAELAATQAHMDKLRREESSLFAETKKELTDGIKGVEVALKTLRDYYAQDKDHEAQEGAASGIIGMLEVIQADFTKGLAESTATEDSAQSEYEATTQANEVEKTGKEQDVKYQTKEAAQLDKAVVEATADRASTQSELDAVVEYLTKLEGMCVAKPETFEERAERRAAEIQGLKQALSILDGEA